MNKIDSTLDCLIVNFKFRLNDFLSLKDPLKFHYFYL